MGLNDAIYVFWRDNRFDAKIAEKLEVVFANDTVQQMIAKRNPVLKDLFVNAGLNENETQDAMRAVRKARAGQYTPAGKLVEKKSNLYPEQTYDDPFYKTHVL